MIAAMIFQVAAAVRAMLHVDLESEASAKTRVAQMAAHLFDHVIPHVSVRRWVRVCQARLPIPLRLLLAAQPKLMTSVLQVVHRVITRYLLGQAGLKAEKAEQAEQADSAAVTRAACSRSRPACRACSHRS